MHGIYMAQCIVTAYTVYTLWTMQNAIQSAWSGSAQPGNTDVKIEMIVVGICYNHVGFDVVAL